LSDVTEQEKELGRQLGEATKIGRTLRTIATDMCHSRRVNFDFASTEIITHALSMSKNFHNNIHQDLIREHGESSVINFDDVFSKVVLNKLTTSGEKISENKANPAIFGILSGDNLSNENLAQAFFSLKGFSIESVTEKGFSVGKEGEFFKIRVSVQRDIISFFDYHDEPNNDIEENALACARYNSQTRFSKAQIVNVEDFQIHFNYIFPHNGAVFIKDIERVVIEFIDEQLKYTKGIW
jgi:hypothetical protein